MIKYLIYIFVLIVNINLLANEKFIVFYTYKKNMTGEIFTLDGGGLSAGIAPTGYSPIENLETGR